MAEVERRTVRLSDSWSGPYDVVDVRTAILAVSHGSVHFGGPGGTQLPESVVVAMVEALSGPLHHATCERRADRLVGGVRDAAGDPVGVDPRVSCSGGARRS